MQLLEWQNLIFLCRLRLVPSTSCSWRWGCPRRAWVDTDVGHDVDVSVEHGDVDLAHDVGVDHDMGVDHDVGVEAWRRTLVMRGGAGTPGRASSSP